MIRSASLFCSPTIPPLQTQFVRLAGVFKFDYRVAYLMPTLIMLGVSFWLFRKRSG